MFALCSYSTCIYDSSQVCVNCAFLSFPNDHGTKPTYECYECLALQDSTLESALCASWHVIVTHSYVAPIKKQEIIASAESTS